MSHFRTCALLGALLLPSLAWSGDMLKARQNYERFCAGCHGFNGMSVTPDAPHLRLNQGLIQGDLQIVDKLKAGSARKPPFLGLLSDEELRDIVAYVRTIR